MALTHPKLMHFADQYLNPWLRKVAGTTYSPISMIEHVGRMSGKVYQTPIIVRKTDDGFILALTYGDGVDWYQNLIAKGGATILWHGERYPVGKPNRISADEGIAAFPALLQPILKTQQTEHFAKVLLR